MADEDKEALADPDIELVGLSLEQLRERSGPRTGLPSGRGGAGYVGGIAHGPGERPGERPGPRSADAELGDPAGPDDRAQGGEGDRIRRALDPVVALFEELRRASQVQPPEAEDAEEDEDAEDDDDDDEDGEGEEPEEPEPDEGW